MIFGSKSDDKVSELEARISKLEAENARFRKALEFYADPKLWTEGHKYRDADDATIFQDESTSADIDGGVIALKALKGE